MRSLREARPTLTDCSAFIWRPGVSGGNQERVRVRMRAWWASGWRARIELDIDPVLAARGSLLWQQRSDLQRDNQLRDGY